MNKNPYEVERAIPAIIRRSSRILQRSSKRVNKIQSPGKTIDLNKDIPVKRGGERFIERMNKNPYEVERAIPAIIRRSSRILQRSSKRVNKMQSPGKTIDLNKDIPVKRGDAFDDASCSIIQLDQLIVSKEDLAKSQSQLDENAIRIMDFIIHKIKFNDSRHLLQMRFGADKINKIQSMIENRCSDQAMYEELKDATQDILANQDGYSNFINSFPTPIYNPHHYELIDHRNINNITIINDKIELESCYFEIVEETELVQNNPSQPFTSSSFDIDNPVVLQKDSVNSNVTTQDDFSQEVIIIDDDSKSPAQSEEKDINTALKTVLRTSPDEIIEYEQEGSGQSVEGIPQIAEPKKTDIDNNPSNNYGKESFRNYGRQSPIILYVQGVVNKIKFDEPESNSPKNNINGNFSSTSKVSPMLPLNNDDKGLKDKSLAKKKRKCQKKIGFRKKTAHTTKKKDEKPNGELDQMASNTYLLVPENFETQECWYSDPNQINNENKPEHIADGLDQDSRLEPYDEDSTLSNEESVDLHNPNQQTNTDMFSVNCEQVCIFREHENRQITSENTFLVSYDESNTFSNEKLIDVHHSNQMNTDRMSSINCQQVFQHVPQSYVTSASRDLVKNQSTSKIDVATNTSPVQVMSLDLWQDFHKVLHNVNCKNEDKKRNLRTKLMKHKLKKEKQTRRKIYLEKRKLKQVPHVTTYNVADSPTSSLSNSIVEPSSSDEPDNVSPYIPNDSIYLSGDEIAHKERVPSTSSNLDETDFEDEIEQLEFCVTLRLCDYSKKYHGIRDTSVDYTTYQDRVLMRDAVKFQEALIERVNHQKYLIQTAEPDTTVKSFIELLCQDKFLKGNCINPSCTLIHKLPSNWCHQLPMNCNEPENNQIWSIANILFNECIKPTVSMYKAVLCWLGRKDKNKYKILLISEYIMRDDSISRREDIWSLVIRVFHCCRLDEWEAVGWLLIYHCKENGAEIANRIIAGTGILNRSYSYFWLSVKPLTQLGIELPLGVIQKLLREVSATENNEGFMRFSEISIVQINDEVNKLSQENASKLHPLISSFRKVYHQYFPIAKKSCLKKTEEPPKYKKLRSESFKTVEIPPFRGNTSSKRGLTNENNASIGQSSDSFTIQEIPPYKKNKTSSLDDKIKISSTIENVTTKAQTSDSSETGESSPLEKNMPTVIEHDETFLSKLALNSENIGNMTQTVDAFTTDEIPPFRNKSFSRMENDKIIASLTRALNVENASSIAKTIMRYCQTEQYQDFVIQTLSDLIPQHKAFSLTKAIFHQINPGYDGRKAKKILARLCVTQMMELIEEKQWYQAYEFLLLAQKNHIDPVISKPVGHVYPQVKVAIACSEISCYNKNYDSAIDLLLSHNLLTADTSKWKIEGDSADFELIIEHVSFLFTNIIEFTNVTKRLFSKIIEIQNDLTTPIDLVEFYEPLLCNMLENYHEYKDQIIPFYTQVSRMDSTLFLTGLTYRALLVFSYQTNNRLFSKEMLSKAIQRLVYSPLDKEENTVIINTCMEQEEMEVYLIEWLRWFDGKISCCSNYQLEIKFQLSRTVDHVENKELTIPSLILHSDDRLSPAICRMTNILDNFPATSHLKRETRLRDDTLFISATYFKLLIEAAKEAY